MTAEQWAYWAVLVPSAFVVGGALYLAARRVIWILAEHDPLQIGYVCLWFGIAGIVDLVGNAVRHFPGHHVHVTLTTWKYVAALCLCFVGMVLVALYQHRHPVHPREAP